MKDKKNIQEIKSLNNQQKATEAVFSLGEWCCVIAIMSVFVSCL